MAYSCEVPILGVPACGMYYKNTIFDLILPRVLAGEKIGKPEIAKLGPGILCLDCPTCNFPTAALGKERRVALYISPMPEFSFYSRSERALSLIGQSVISSMISSNNL